MAGLLSWLLFNRYTAAGAIALGLLAGAYWKGYSVASAKCQDAELKAEIAAMQRDFAAWRAADQIETILQQQIEAERNDLQDKVAKYETELGSRTDGRCSLNDRDVRSLDGLRGGKR